MGNDFNYGTNLGSDLPAVFARDLIKQKIEPTIAAWAQAASVAIERIRDYVLGIRELDGEDRSAAERALGREENYPRIDQYFNAVQ